MESQDENGIIWIQFQILQKISPSVVNLFSITLPTSSLEYPISRMNRTLGVSILALISLGSTTCGVRLIAAPAVINSGTGFIRYSRGRRAWRYLQRGNHFRCSFHGSSSGCQFFNPPPQQKHRMLSSGPGQWTCNRPYGWGLDLYVQIKYRIIGEKMPEPIYITFIIFILTFIFSMQAQTLPTGRHQNFSDIFVCNCWTLIASVVGLCKGSIRWLGHMGIIPRWEFATKP